ncbi:MAG: putative peptidyl-prolyl cis-trans isomerase [Candidatus Heimdallarchaeota archaeon AB_125]|nr:MAG: putative peptidyl-prolyl cis-trans isomerase [Candidatus Heimdallarchaeota archaeon AB_125]
MTKAKVETNKGIFIIELYDEHTPNTVKNFVSLIQDGYYDGVKFHRVIPDFVVQGGDPTGTGKGGPGYQIADEVDNPVQLHELGALSMANSGPNTNGSQFFIVLNPANCRHLNKKHTVFGKVIDGMKIINMIRQGDKMVKVTVEDESDIIQNHELQKL